MYADALKRSADDLSYHAAMGGDLATEDVHGPVCLSVAAHQMCTAPGSAVWCRVLAHGFGHMRRNDHGSVV